MKAEWLHKNNAAKLILFFNGWGMTIDVVKHLAPGEFDVLVMSDYRDLILPELVTDSVADYDEIYLIGWSFGVWASQTVADFSFAGSVAICGTGCPVSAREGIHPKIFQATLDGLTAESLYSFDELTCGDADIMAKLTECARADLESMKQELVSVQEKVEAGMVLPDNLFQKVIMAKRDKIFSYRSQKRYWQDRAECVEIEASHLPLFSWNSWEEILSYGG